MGTVSGLGPAISQMQRVREDRAAALEQDIAALLDSLPSFHPPPSTSIPTTHIRASHEHFQRHRCRRGRHASSRAGGAAAVGGVPCSDPRLPNQRCGRSYTLFSDHSELRRRDFPSLQEPRFLDMTGRASCRTSNVWVVIMMLASVYASFGIVLVSVDLLSVVDEGQFLCPSSWCRTSLSLSWSTHKSGELSAPSPPVEP